MSKLNTYILEHTFITESGFSFDNPEIAYQTWGTLNEDKSNVVLVIHALTGNSNLEEWFQGLFWEKSPIDLNKHFVICINIPGSCYGSLGPWSINPKTGKAYKKDFPVFSIRDIARFQQHLLNGLGTQGIELVIGGSMGGMIALEFALMDDRVNKLCLMVMGKSHSPWAIGISHAQRMALYADPKWNGGDYDKNDPPQAGLAAARAMAMLTYRAPSNYEYKFSRDRNTEKDLFEVESYLEYQGQKLVGRFDALSYDRLTKSMDTHDVSRNRGPFEEVLGSLSVPTLVIGVDSDRLYPVSEQKELVDLIPNSIYREITSGFGHDAFLIEFDQINDFLTSFLKSEVDAIDA
ncbi:MAG: homoserine O-acetyltransferase [Balneola sp.]|nr:MAG: homoserine O-acetyltransferase [Balneola sp.]